jgi:hypothetical protein
LWITIGIVVLSVLLAVRSQRRAAALAGKADDDA